MTKPILICTLCTLIPAVLSGALRPRAAHGVAESREHAGSLSGPVPAALMEGQRSKDVALESFIVEMAKKHGFDHGELQATFRNARFRPQIVELMNKQYKRLPWEQYRGRFVNREKIEGGAGFWRRHEKKLALARQRYGVPEEIITAVIGVETHYGRNKGRFEVLDALTTLAFDYPKRAAMFRVELEHYLLLMREEE